MAERAWRRAATVVLGGVLVVAVTACEDPTEPSFSSGSMSFEWAPEAGGAATAWSVSGSCGRMGFILGSSTCAVGSEESGFMAALGVRTLEDGGFDTATLVHPTGIGSCDVSSADGTRCTLAFVPDRPGTASAPVAQYVLDTGTISVQIVQVDGVPRLTGTFEGTALDKSTRELEPIVITDGTFDVELVP